MMSNFMAKLLYSVAFFTYIVSSDHVYESPLNIEVMADASDFNCQWLESPLWSEAGQFLLFSDLKYEKDGKTSGMIWRWDAENGVTKWLEDAGIVGPGPAANITHYVEAGPNGLEWGWNGDGDLLICQHGKHRIVRLNVTDVVDGVVAPDKVSVVADTFNGLPFNSPNDLTLVDGKLYFTDPPFGRQMTTDSDPFAGCFDRMTQPVAGVYMIPSEGGTVERIVDNIEAPNGIAISSVGNVFIAFTSNMEPHFRMYTMNGTDISKDSLEKLVSDHRIDTNVKNISFALNDGISAYKDIIFGAGPGGVYVLDGSSGMELDFIRLDDLTSNVYVGGGYLWITANQRLLRVKLRDDMKDDDSAGVVGPSGALHIIFISFLGFLLL